MTAHGRHCWILAALVGTLLLGACRTTGPEVTAAGIWSSWNLPDGIVLELELAESNGAISGVLRDNTEFSPDAPVSGSRTGNSVSLTILDQEASPPRVGMTMIGTLRGNRLDAIFRIVDAPPEQGDPEWEVLFLR